MTLSNKFFVLVFTLFIHTFSFSNHLTGGDLSYRCVGTNEFEFTLVIYNECGAENQVGSIPKFDITYSSSTLGIYNSFDLFLQSQNGVEVNIFCDRLVTNCESSSSLIRGVRKFTYIGRVTLPNAAPDWMFRFQRSARSDEITTAQTSLETDYIIEAFLNTEKAPCNSSPQFDIGNNSIITGLVDQTISEFVGGTDTDELVYTLIKPKTNIGEGLVYNSGYNETNFISTNGSPQIANNGFITFESTENGEVGITDVLIEEFRNGELIASITRGIQVTTKLSDNEVPVLSGWNDPNFTDLDNTELFVCVGDSIGTDITHQIFAIDANDEDNLSYTISPSRFSIRQDVLNLIWIPTANDTGRNVFTITVRDDHCPEIASAQKEYVVNVLPRPVFEIGPDYIVKCVDPEFIEPIFSSTGNYSYLWTKWTTEINRDAQGNVIDSTFITFDNLSTNETYAPNSVDQFALTVTDEFGCSSTDFLTTEHTLIPSFTVIDYCFDADDPVETTFIDASSSPDFDITTWEWSILPENISSEDSTFKYTFTTPGEKIISLTITNSAGCQRTTGLTINVCEPPIVGFEIDSIPCTDIPLVIFNDTTDYSLSCVEDEHDVSPPEFNYGDGSPKDNLGAHEYKTPGIYNVTMEVTTAGNCISEVTNTIQVFERPNLDLIQSDTLSLICSNPDTVLTSFLIKEGTAPLSYEWKKDTVFENNPVIGIDSFIAVSDTGWYSLFILDAEGCRDSTKILLINPTISDFSYKPACLFGDSLELIDSSSSTESIVSWIWETEGIVFSNEQFPKFLPSRQDSFNIKLTAIDANGCEKTSEKYVRYYLPRNTFNIEPDTVQICVSDNVTATSFDSSASFGNISAIWWYTGEGDTLLFEENDLDNGFSYRYRYSQPAEATIYHRIRYNEHPGVHDFFCIRDTTETIQVEPEFKIEILNDRLCVGDSGIFDIEKIIGDLGINITNTDWTFVNTAKGINDTFDTRQVEYFFEDEGNYVITINAEDSLGCKATDRLTQFIVSRLPEPQLEYLGDRVCANELGSFNTEVDQTDQLLENITDYYIIAKGDTIISGKGNPRLFDFDYQFNGSRINEITYYLEDGDAATNPETPCRRFTTVSLELIGLPDLAISADTLCPNENIIVLNESKNTEFSGNIIGYSVFEDPLYIDYPVETDSWIRNYEFGGTKIFELVARTDSGCTATLKEDLFVYPGPKAGFELEEEFAEAFIPLNLLDISDASYMVDGDTATLTHSYYEMGEETEYTDFNVQHTYNEITQYNVTHSVQNSYGCTDTTVQKLDLLPYLDIPNAFSPNDDGTNDGLGLIWKSIITLEHYKIYNRWGQIIFDGDGDLNAIWDGTFKGVDQEVGTYIVYVKALGAYDTEFEFKKNINLIR